MTAMLLNSPLTRVATGRHYLMCRPDFFDVTYAINPWMDPSRPVDRGLARRQWGDLKATYERLGHRVDVLEPVPGLPDMVFAANGAFVVGQAALGAKFRERVRAAEAAEHAAWLGAYGIRVTRPLAVNEGEGDFAWAHGRILAASGFRADPAARAELAHVFDLPVVALDLVDPRFYHLDTALAVLDANTVAYLPEAFSAESNATIRSLYPDAIEVDPDEAHSLALNAVSDGRHVVLAAQAPKLAAAVEQRGFVAVPVDVSEFLKAGGGVKCMTLELHRYRWPGGRTSAARLDVQEVSYLKEIS
jgi:ornithine--oxo-acid transaminase